MTAVLTIARYPRFLGFAGFLSMALFRMPLLLHKNINFWKLLGTGRNGTFDIHPDWRQWGILIVENKRSGHSKTHLNHNFIYGSFITGWWKFFACETWTIFLDPVEGHGAWDGKEVFGKLPKQSEYEGIIAVLTRATIRVSKLAAFWKNVDSVAAKMEGAPGFITSLGIGEVPWIKQATFSIWKSKNEMKNFSYKMNEHTKVIQKTKMENWYSEDMFIRFKPVASFGTLHGKDPLGGNLF